MPEKLYVFKDRTCCPACNCKKTEELIKLEWDHNIIVNLFKKRNFPTNYFKEGAYILLECQRCGLIYQKYSPNEELIFKIYNQWIKRRNPKFIDIHNNRFIPYNADRTINNISEINLFLNILSKSPMDCKVLDFGMGWGGWCKAAQLMGLDVYGTEITDLQIEYNISQGLKVITWDDIPNYNFDFINTDQVLEHVAEPFQVIQHLLKGLAPKGLLKISVPDASNVKSTLKKNFKSEWFYAKGKRYSLNAIEPLQHLNGYSHNTLITMASQLGLIEVKTPLGSVLRHSVGTLTFMNILKLFIRRIVVNNFKNTNLLFQKV
jgi:2-polyprenyl-3-methyl-5-hydroxy-6-metoxy-1,4-benzoquinol methylase